MTIKTALRGTMGLGAACLLAGTAAAEDAVSTGPATAPSTSDYQLRQPSPERNPAPITAPDRRDGTLAPRDSTGSLGPRDSTGSLEPRGRAGSPGTGMTDSQARSGVGAIQDDSAPVSVAGRVEKIDRADDTMEISGVDRQLKLDSSTRVTRNGSQASLSDVQEGEQVRASFDDGFPARVRQVEIMSPSSAGPSNEPSGTGAATSTEPASPSDMSGTSNTAPDSTTTGTPPGSRVLPRRDSPSTVR